MSNKAGSCALRGTAALKKSQMKKLTKTILVASLLLIAFCQLPTAFAQGPGFEGDVEDTPIDGGVTLIAAATIGYGIKKLNEHRKK